MAARYPRYFSAIRPNMLSLNAPSPVLSVLSANFARMRALYPKSTDPSVTFVLGRFSTGGTVNPPGILIGTEFYASDAATPLNELGSFQRANAKPVSTVPVIVAHEWAATREAAVWTEFQQDLNGTDLSRWPFNQQNATPDRPGDLGYYVGYRIAKAFYDGAADKSAAIRSIVEVSDARAFLTASGYAPR